MDFLLALFNSMPGAAGQGLIWGIMAIGVYVTYRILDVADLTVDGSFATGGAVAVVLILRGCNLWLAMLAAFAGATTVALSHKEAGDYLQDFVGPLGEPTHLDGLGKVCIVV